MERMCEICKRRNIDHRMLGPFIHTNTLSAHFNCVLFSPITPDETSRNADGVAGVIIVSYARKDDARNYWYNFFFFQIFGFPNLMSIYSASFLQQMCNFCKAKGAHIGCCYDVGNDAKIEFCKRKYHIDCGMLAGASFTVSKDTGAVPVCFEHRDRIER